MCTFNCYFLIIPTIIKFLFQLSFISAPIDSLIGLNSISLKFFKLLKLILLTQEMSSNNLWTFCSIHVSKTFPDLGTTSQNAPLYWLNHTFINNHFIIYSLVHILPRTLTGDNAGDRALFCFLVCWWNSPLWQCCGNDAFNVPRTVRQLGVERPLCFKGHLN